MIKTKIREVGHSAVMMLTTEMMTMLDSKESDTLFVVLGEDRILKGLAHDSALAKALAAAGVVMDENGDLLQALA